MLVADDYGHHPAGSGATAAAKAGFDRRVITVFQPHRYSRTQHLRNDFLTAFYQSDVLIVMDIYAAGEAPIEGVHARDLADGIAAHGHREVLYLGGDRAAIVDYLCESTRTGDLVLTLGAGDVGQLGGELLAPGSDPDDFPRDRQPEIGGENRFGTLSFHTPASEPRGHFIVRRTGGHPARSSLSGSSSLDGIGGNNLERATAACGGALLEAAWPAEFNGGRRGRRG